MVQLHDALTLDRQRKSQDGYVAVRARSARAGLYDYLGREVDPSGKRFKADDVVKVYRPENEVFATDSLASFVARPITNDHPTVAVTAANWRDHARGTVMQAVRDGEFVGFDLAFMDAGIVADLDSGKRELSNGYSCDLSFEAGMHDGVAYQAVQRNIRGNHVALVDAGRAGSQCRVSDGFNGLDIRISDGGNGFATCDANPSAIADLKGKKSMNFIMLDDLKVDLDDADGVKAAITKLQGQLADANKAKGEAEGKKVADAATIVTKDAEITDLKAKLEAAAITPAKLADAAKEYADVQAKAKAVGVTVAADADTAAIKKAVVTAKMGDAAKDYTADHIGIAFDALTKDAKAPANDQHQPILAPKAIATDNAAVRDLVRASQY